MDVKDVKDEARADVGLYIRARFERVQRRYDLEGVDYDFLTKQADGLFQWAFTVCNWILGGKGYDPKERLDGLRRDRTNISAHEALDNLYSDILTHAFNGQLVGDGLHHFRSVMAQVLSASKPLTIDTLQEISLANNPQSIKIKFMLSDLGSVLNGTQSHNTPVQPFHTSFRDFLLDKERSKSWCIDLEAGHMYMVSGCFRFMKQAITVQHLWLNVLIPTQ